MAGTPSGGAARFSCPPNFTEMPPASESTRFSLEVLTGPDRELWLIQAPVDFTPDCLNGRLVPLSGSQIVKGKLEGKRHRHRYRVLSSSGPRDGEATLLAPSAETGGGLTCAPAAQGNLRIFEGLQESLSGTALQPIPASPAPQIPPGLRPRFCAFGGSPPVTGPGAASALKSPSSRKKKRKRHTPEASLPQETVNGHGAPDVDTALGSLESYVEKKKKKQQRNELEPVAAEPAAEMLEPVGGLVPSTTKKRKKKAKETEMVEPEMGMLEQEEKAELEPVVKPEPLEETPLSPSKRRRHKRQEGAGVVSLLQVEVKPQEEALPVPSSKKKKKEKGHSVMMEAGPETLEPDIRPLELHGEMAAPDLPPGVEPQAGAPPASAKKRKKKEKWQNATTQSGAEEVAPPAAMAPDSLEPLVALGSPKKKKKKKDTGHKVTEPGTAVTDCPGEMMAPELPGKGESDTSANLTPTKKKKKRQGQESGVPEAVSQGDTPEPLLNLESGEVVPTGREKKRKKLQLSPM